MGPAVIADVMDLRRFARFLVHQANEHLLPHMRFEVDHHRPEGRLSFTEDMSHVHRTGYLEESRVLTGKNQFHPDALKGAAGYLERGPGGSDLKGFRGKGTGLCVMVRPSAGDIIIPALLQFHAVGIPGSRVESDRFYGKPFPRRRPIL